ncbi:MAG TPA: hypothetical protein VLS96_20710, partial [Nodosilinea sp.]|nr:hypothetical protein [Nodosilinea sp.]
SLREAHGDEPPARPISLAFGLLWVGINALAFATHYFTALALLAQALVLLGLAWHQGRTKPQALWRRPWQRLYGVMLGTLAACLVWLPVLLNFYGSGQSSNVAIDLSQPMRWVDPLAQMLAGLIFMVITPITHAQGAVGIGAVVLSVVVLLPLLVGLVRRLIQAAGLVSRSAAGRFDLVVMGGFVLAAIGLFFVVTYGLAMDITRGHRYNVVFHPGVVVLVGGLLAVYWPEPGSDAVQVTARIPLTGWQLSGRRSVQVFWLAGLASAIFVVTNLAFAKYFAPAHLIETIQAESSYPAVVGFPTHIEDKPTVIGHELLSIGWEMHRHFHPDDPAGGWATPPQFFLWTLPSTPTVPPEETLATILSMPLRPFDLWFLHSSQDLSDQGCQPLGQGNRGSHGYSHYICR